MQTSNKRLRMTDNRQQQLENDGYALIRRVFSNEELGDVIERLTKALENYSDDSRSIRSRAGTVYAARNVLSIFPDAGRLWHRDPLTQLLRDTLGDGFGLVRGLYFNKPPERSWSLPWHKDLTIAVQRNDLASTHFTNPTRKAGVAHVEASQNVLESMLTLRIHLDAATDENGPLVVIPGSHRDGKKSVESDRGMRKILTAAGDVLAMRPLLSHSSGNSQPGTSRHRRILHLEFSADHELPDGYRWHNFKTSP